MLVMMVLLMVLSWYLFKVLVHGRADGVDVAGVLVDGCPQFFLFVAGQFITFFGGCRFVLLKHLCCWSIVGVPHAGLCNKRKGSTRQTPLKTFVLLKLFKHPSILVGTAGFLMWQKSNSQ